MNRSILVTGIVAFLVGAALTYAVTAGIGPQPTEETQATEENPYLEIPVIDAYYQGEKLWFVHTDVSDEAMAGRLTRMVNFNTLYSQQLGGVPLDQVGKLYVFVNGLKQSGEKPWQGGPFGFQLDIFDSIPGDPDYTPIRSPALVTWADSAAPRILKSVEELLEAEQNGELTIQQTDILVSVPIVRWPGDYLGGQSSLE